MFNEPANRNTVTVSYLDLVAIILFPSPYRPMVAILLAHHIHLVFRTQRLTLPECGDCGTFSKLSRGGLDSRSFDYMVVIVPPNITKPSNGKITIIWGYNGQPSTVAFFIMFKSVTTLTWFCRSNPDFCESKRDVPNG